MGNNSITRSGIRNRTFLRMVNSYPAVHGIRYYLVVEGESDKKLFNRFLDRSVCRAITICEESDDNSGQNRTRSYVKDDGGSNKEQIIQFFDDRTQKTPGLLGIVDADFDNIKGRENLPDNIILTDYHDIEMVILKTQPDLSSLYSEIADLYLVQEYEKSTRIIIDTVIAIAYELGLLRLVCRKYPKENCPSVKDTHFWECIDKSFGIDMDEIINRIIRGSVGKCVYRKDLKDEIASEKAHNYGKYQVCCGHDVTEILAYCFSADSNLLKCGNKEYQSRSKIETILRVTYNPDSFKTTNMFKRILEWQTSNTRILDPNLFP